MPYPNKPQLSATEKADLALRFFFLGPLRSSLSMIRCTAISISRGYTSISGFAIGSIIRTILEVFSFRQAQFLLPTCIDTYRSWIFQQSKLYPDSNIDVEPIPSALGASLLWVGNRHTAKKFILLLHGGAFYMPLGPAHLFWASALVESLSSTSNFEALDVAVAVMDYTLAPERRYPTQLIEVSGMERVVGKVCVTVGEAETLRDEGVEHAERLRKKSKCDVRLEVLEGYGHDFITMEAMGGVDGPAMRGMKGWIGHVWGGK